MRIEINVTGSVDHVIRVEGVPDDALAALKAEVAALRSRVDSQLPTAADMANLRGQTSRVDKIDPISGSPEAGSAPTP